MRERLREGSCRAGMIAPVLALLLLALAFAPPAAIAKRGKVKLTERSQTKLTESERITARVRAGGRWKIRAHARIQAARKGAKSAPITKRVTTRVRGKRKLELGLNARGQRRLTRCGAQRLIVQVRVIGGKPKRDRGKRLRSAKLLRVDAPGCAGGDNAPTDPARPATPAFAVGPGEDARHTNQTPRGYEASGVDSGPVTIALFDCANVEQVGDGYAFVESGGRAQRGSPPAGITGIGGSATDGAPGKVSTNSDSDGSLEFTVSGADGCARPVVFADADSDGFLDLDSQGVPTEPYGAGGEVAFEPQGVQPQNADRCDFLDASVCLQPFPNDIFTTADAEAATGRRIDLNALSMPRNRAGIPILPDDHNRADGFSPGNMLITRIPGLDTPEAFANTGAVPIDDMARYLDLDQPVVVIDAATGERHPVWAELDANPSDPADVNLIIRPQRNFIEGHHYLVALRNLRDADDRPIEAGRAFQLYRDRIIGSDPAVESRRPKMEQIFAGLSSAGIGRSGLYLAWDFTVASAESLAQQRLLSIRDDAFAKLGDTDLADLTVQGNSPAFNVTSVTDKTAAEDAEVARVVEGTVTAPCYLDTPGCAQGGQFRFAPGSYEPLALPGNLATFQFQCNIPRSALDGGANPARPSLYGHGLLGGLGEVGAGNVKRMGNDHRMMFCATDWAGFSTKDAPTIALILQDLNNFPKLVDHSEQGFINFMMLGRAMIHSQGFSSNSAFQDGAGQSVIDTTRLFYDGNSQGGILGGPLVATSPDIDRGVLGVPGMNYSTLLRRSSDFEGYATGEIFGPDTPLGLYDSYPDELERPLILSLMQMLWDRGENDGYAQHMSGNPYPNTPPSEVLLHEAFSDHQVANVSAEVMARTLGAPKVAGLDSGRFPGADPLFDIPTISSFPYSGSAIVSWDSGSPNAPVQNVPPHEGDDPHGHPRSDPKAQQQKSDFLQVGGKVTNVCGAGPCYANGYTGP